MSKTPQERYDEIKKEIWQISESYMLTTKNKPFYELKDNEKEHLELLHFRICELSEALNTIIICFHDIKVPLMYRKMVDQLRKNLYIHTSSEYSRELREESDLNKYASIT